jgi:RHS repeat-associated protein
VRHARGGPGGTDKLYTGQQIEPSTTGLGLYNYKARFYSTTLGRFLSPDTLVVDGLNRYTYVKNNPLRYIDPSGRCVTFFGEKLPCTESAALNILTCAVSTEACAFLMWATRQPFSLDLPILLHSFASWALYTGEFQHNFVEHNPFWIDERTLYWQGRYRGPATLERVKGYASQLYTPDFDRELRGLQQHLFDYCSAADCKVLVWTVDSDCATACRAGLQQQ